MGGSQGNLFPRREWPPVPLSDLLKKQGSFLIPDHGGQEGDAGPTVPVKPLRVGKGLVQWPLATIELMGGGGETDSVYSRRSGL